MGYMRHHAIIVSGFDVDIEQAHKKAKSLFPEVSNIVKSGKNCYLSFFIPPDGSKEGWTESDKGDETRDKYTEWLNKKNEDTGDVDFFLVSWVEIQYGDDDEMTKIVRHSDE